MTDDNTAAESAAETAQSRHQEVDELNDRARSLLHSDPHQSGVLALQARELATHSVPPYDYGYAESLLIQAILAWDRSEYQAALRDALRALELFEAVSDTRKQAETLIHIAGIHYLLGNSSQALSLGYRALQLVEEHDDDRLLASILNDTGYMMLHIGNPETAMAQLTRSLDMHRRLGDRHGEAQALDSIGKGYLLLGDVEQALAYERQSLTLDRAIAYRRAEAEALANIGRMLLAVGDRDQAIEFLQQALALSRARSYREFEAAILLDLGQIWLEDQALDRALETLQEARRVAEAIDTKPLLAQCHKVLADVYERIGDLPASLAQYKQFHTIQEAAINELATLRLHTLQATHEAETARQQTEIYRLRNVALQKEIDEREKLIAELDAFARTVAHDLKNPLWVITGLGEYILEHLEANGDESLVKLGRDLVTMGYKTGRIVDELLMLAQVRRQSVSIRPIDMAAILVEVKTRLAQQIEDYAAEVIVPPAWPPALGYAPWVEEVWANYITNAIKYGGTPPRVELGATADGDHVRFWVRDNGRGISSEDQDKLFAEFTRLTSLSGDQHGHGLGLSIVRRIVEKLGGEVAIESASGGGSTFSFTLPALANPESEESAL